MAEYIEYHPLKFWLDPASIAEIVAHIQTYLVNNPINSTTEIETIIHDYLIAHPELIGGVDSVNGLTGEVVLTADNISGGENVTIKDVLDSLQDQIDDIVASIPSDYQQLINDVSDLKSALNEDYPKLASVNLFDKTAITPDSFVNYTNGRVQATTVGACASDWMPCQPETVYVMSNASNHQTNSCAFYDSSKTYISGITTGGARAPYTFTTPENAAFMRWTVYNLVIDSTQIEQSRTPSPYSDYQKAIQTKDVNLINLGYELNKFVTVGASGCDYTSILEALSSTPDSTPIKITTGTYNIVNEYTEKYGSSYWTNYNGYATTNPFDRGLWVNNGRKVVMEAGAKIVFDLDGSASVKNNFSVFATGYNSHIEGGIIDIGENKCRYSIHDDWGSKNGDNVFKNIVFSGTPVSQSHIGGGMGFHLNYHIIGCVFLNNTAGADVTYHNNLDASAENRVEVTGCYGSKKCIFRWYGNSTKISYCFVNDCHFSQIYAEAHPTATPNTNVNVRLIKWGCEETQS